MEPTKEWIDARKKKLTEGGKLNIKLYKGMVGKDVYVFRTLVRSEHLDIQKAVFPEGMPSDATQVKAEQNATMEDMTLKLVVLWPENVEVTKLDAGVAPTLVPQILIASGFTNPVEPEEL